MGVDLPCAAILALVDRWMTLHDHLNILSRSFCYTPCYCDVAMT